MSDLPAVTRFTCSFHQRMNWIKFKVVVTLPNDASASFAASSAACQQTHADAGVSPRRTGTAANEGSWVSQCKGALADLVHQLLVFFRPIEAIDLFPGVAELLL